MHWAETRTSNGIEEIASVCDAMLLTNNTVYFVELKNQKEAFLSKAVQQIEDTIELFKANHYIDAFQFKRAHVSNIGHPGFSDFYKKNKILLRIETTIDCK